MKNILIEKDRMVIDVAEKLGWELVFLETPLGRLKYTKKRCLYIYREGLYYQIYLAMDDLSECLRRNIEVMRNERLQTFYGRDLTKCRNMVKHLEDLHAALKEANLI